MRVFVIGATGIIGTRAVGRLAGAGHDVSAVARTPEKASTLRRLGARPVIVSIFDSTGLATEMAGHDVVVNLATSIPAMTQMANPRNWRMNDRIRTEGAAAVAEAAHQAGVERLIQESVVFGYSDGGSTWISADDQPYEPAPVAESSNAAEAAAEGFTRAGGVGIVLRFGMFVAPDSDHTITTLRLAKRGFAAVLGSPDSYRSSIHADDAASAVVAALDAPAGTYDVVDDDPMTARDQALVLAQTTKRRRCVRPPGWLTRVGGPGAAQMARSQRVTNRRFKASTEWAPAYPSFREAIDDASRSVAPAGRPPLTARLVRPVLWLLALTTTILGVWAATAPQNFFDSFPGLGRTWVAVDGPFNEHLVRDFGGLNLAMAAVLVAAAMRPSRYLVRTAALAYMLFALPHLLYHAVNLDVLEPADQVANLVVLSLAALAPAVLVFGSEHSDPA